MIILTIDQIEKGYGANVILESVSFELQEGERIGLIGRNGAGKTTLFKLITGIESCDSGNIFTKKGARVGYLEQIPKVDESLTAREVIYLAFDPILDIERRMNVLSEKIVEAGQNVEESMLHEYDDLQRQFEIAGGYEMDVRFNKVVEGLKIKEEILARTFCDLSGGEKTRALLGRILLEAPDILLLDEPTNHLDIQALEWLESYLSGYPGGVVIISHDRQFLDQVVNKIVTLEDGVSRIWLGNYSKYIADRDEWYRQQMEIYKQQQRKVRAMEEAISRFRLWSDMGGAEKMHIKMKAMQKRLDRMDKIDKPKGEGKAMGLKFSADGRTGNQVFRLRDVAAGYDGKALFTGVDLEIDYQDCAVLMGPNGIGKTTLFKLLMAQLEPMQGDIKTGSRVKIGYLEQEVEFERSERTVFQLFNEETGIGEFAAKGKLARFMFFTEDLSKPISKLSGGERVKLKLCLMMELGINVLLLDEPTNHIDIASREVLEMALQHFEGTILMISHDRYFINQLADKVITLSPNGCQSFEGGYQEWREEQRLIESGVRKSADTGKVAEPQKNGQMNQTGDSTSSNKEWRDTDARARQNEARRRAKRIEELDALMPQLEKELAAINADIEQYAADFSKLGDLVERQAAKKEQLDMLELEYLELHEAE
jgi:ATPase subunit of ABC transporter with duplicated ATPase domains